MDDDPERRKQKEEPFGCSKSSHSLFLLFGIGVSKDKISASTYESCSCLDCQAVKIIISKLRLKKQHQEFSDIEFAYANSHFPNSNYSKFLLAMVLLQRMRQQEAIILFKELADKDFAVACLFLGNLPYRAISREDRMRYLEKAHALGAYEATIKLAIMNFHQYNSEADNARAFALFKTVEDGGFAHALYKLAKWNEDPTGPKNHNEVVRLYRLAAQQGNAKANYKLGLIMSEGKYHLPKNVPQAVEYFSVAADKGNVDAQLALGYIFFNGNGVNKDETKARKYFELASKQGNEWARMMFESA